MATFKIPKSICSIIDQLIKAFWWVQLEERTQFFAPISWDKLCQPKRQGGLGFKHTSNINNAMLAKTAWFLSNSTLSLASKTFKEKYGSPLEPNIRWAGSLSLTWKDINTTTNMLKLGLCKLIGNWANTSIWFDKWITNNLHCVAIPNQTYRGQLNHLTTFKDLIISQTNNRNLNLQSILFDQETSRNILKIHLDFNQMDRFIWKHSKSGDVTVKKFLQRKWSYLIFHY